MAIRSMNGLSRMVGNVRRAALLREPAVLPDGRLLESFLTCGDDAAFALLVKRHGPMVLGVCTRVIGNIHDAEDAFQAVFLVLARKAGSIVPRDLVGNWLYGVAYRTALQARGRVVRHRARERQVKDMPHPTVAPEVDFEALHQALDGELDRLPEKYRVPVVLCDLEGRSRKDVAGQLKIPEGTLSSRLAKGRDLLAKRLARHGIALSGSALAVVLAGQASAVQPALVGAAVNAAVLTATGQSTVGAVSAEVLALSEGVVKTMFLSKIKVISVLVLGVLLGLGAGLFGMPNTLTPAVQAAHEVAVVQDKAADADPLDGQLLLDQNVQKELRLSKNQVGRINAISHDVDAKSEPKKKEMQELQKQIDELQKRMEQLIATKSKVQGEIELQRTQSIGKAAPDILSDKAVTRLRQIQRQQRGLNELLADAKVQRMLKIDDEQVKKIETILKTESVTMADFIDFGGNVRFWDTVSGRQSHLWGDAYARPITFDSASNTLILAEKSSSLWNARGLQKLYDVLNPAQQRTLADWLGEPYQGSSWHALRTSQK